MISSIGHNQLRQMDADVVIQERSTLVANGPRDAFTYIVNVR